MEDSLHLYSYSIVEHRFGWTAVNVISYNRDGSFDDYYDIFRIRDNETEEETEKDIRAYILNNYGLLLGEQ